MLRLTELGVRLAQKLYQEEDSAVLQQPEQEGLVSTHRMDGFGESVAVDGDTVVTAGTGTFTLPSPYPSGLRIGTVSSFGSAREEPGEFQTVQVTPFVNPFELSTFAVFVPVSPAAKRRAGA